LPRILWKANLAYILTVSHTRGAFPEERKPYFDDTYQKHASIAMDKEAVQVVEQSGEFEQAEVGRTLHVYCPLKTLLDRFKGKRKLTVRTYLLRDHMRLTAQLPYPRFGGMGTRKAEFIFGIDLKGAGEPDFELEAGVLQSLMERSHLVFAFWPRLTRKLELCSRADLDADPLPTGVWQKYVSLEDLVTLWNLGLSLGQEARKVSAITITRHPVMRDYPVVFASLPDAEGRLVTGHFVFGMRLEARELRSPDLSSELIAYVRAEHELTLTYK
jgi:hypothetical protein